MATELTDEVVEFVSTGTRTAKLGFIASDGRPLVAPVWFVVDDGELVFNTGRDTAKGRALARDPRVTMCIDDETPPYSFVQVQGVAVTSADPQQLLDTATRIGGRYMGEDRAEEFGRRNGAPGELVVRVRPTKVIAAFDVAHSTSSTRDRSPQPTSRAIDRSGIGNHVGRCRVSYAAS